MEMSQSDKNHLEWIFDRLVEVYGENPNCDHMLKFKEIINNL